MKRRFPWRVTIALLVVQCAALAQQTTEQPTARPQSDAKTEAPVTWRLGDQTWSFKEIETAYEPEKGTIEPARNNLVPLAVWTLRVAKDFDPGTTLLHNNQPASPFKVTFLDANRTVINLDVQEPKMTPTSGKLGDTVQLYVPLPDSPLIKEIRYVRVQRRTNVGF